MNAAVITTNRAEKRLSLTIHQAPNGTILLDYYQDAYSVKVVNLKDACSELGINFAQFVSKQADLAALEVEALKEIYGQGDEVEEAKERHGLFCAMV